MKLGMLELTYEALGTMLNLPVGHSVTAIVPQSAREVSGQSVLLLVSGPTLPDHVEGSMPQIVEMVRDRRGRMHFS